MSRPATSYACCSLPRPTLRERLEMPVFIREMRARMRGKRAPVLLFSCTALAILVACSSIALTSSSRVFSGTSYQPDMELIGETLFRGMIYLEVLFIVVTVPALTAGSFAAERKQQTLEALLLTPLSSWNILLGKLYSVLSFCMMILLCTLPVMAIAFIFGGVSPGQVLWCMALLLSAATLFGALGLFCAAWLKRTAPAVIVSYLLGLFSRGAAVVMVLDDE